VLALELPRQVVFSGAVTGVTYAVMAAGVILVFRSTRVVNFAVAEMGGFAAALLYRLVVDWDVPFWLSFAACAVVGTASGIAIDLLVVRRLFTAPRVILLVALIGASQLLLFFQLVLPHPTRIAPFPTAWSDRFEIGGVIVRSEELLALVVLPVLVGALAVVLERTKWGLAIRASAANADAARLAGIDVKQMSSVVWALAGALASVGAMLYAPLGPQGLAVASTATGGGPGLLLRVLSAALLAGMTSLPRAIVAGILLGAAESVVTFNYDDQRGLLDALLLLVVVGALVARRRARVLAETGTGRWSLAPRVRPVPPELARIWWVRRLPALAWLVALVAALAPLVLFDRPSQQHAWTEVLVYAMVALSLTVLTGWAGQLSLGQFAFVGLGGMTTAALVGEGVGFLPALAGGALVAAAAAVVVGVPALRRPGLFLAVVSFAFAVAAASWLLWRDVFVGGDLEAELPRQVLPLPSALFDEGLDLRANGSYYALTLSALAAAVTAVAWLQRTRFGRSMIAVRDNERAAASLGISPARVKLVSFALGGALAGLAGGLLVGLLTETRPNDYLAADSLRVISIVVVGGLASIGGALLGAAWVVGLPVLFDDSVEVGLLTSGAGLLILLLYVPGGLVQLLYAARDALVSVAARRMRPDGTATAARVVVPASITRATRPLPEGLDAMLCTREVTVRFGARVVVDGADLRVGRSEVVGLIGANGAGKTTLMDAICGFVPYDGEVRVIGRDVRRLAPAARARLGLGRSWQGAELFADLTVRETIGLAVRGGRPWERGVRAEADEIVAFLGLGRFAGTFVDELSTGTRRIVELACLVASGARLLCLDEPTAGIAQREAEAFGPLVLRLREELDAALLVIEHDMPLVLGISDRVYCLEAGRIIAEGRPAAVRADPLVIASYLGTDPAAVQRSGAPAPGASRTR
jgi:ABC-type branched-subunit amino acid transport system ATPase component/ABC-type branched-subunit amino acid transport system permease subunit